MYVYRQDQCCGTCQHWTGTREVEAHTFRIKCENGIALCPLLRIKRLANSKVTPATPCARKNLWSPWVNLP